MKLTFLLSGFPIAIAFVHEAWVAMATFIGIDALLPIVALGWPSRSRATW